MTKRAGSICSGFGGRTDSSVRPVEAGAFGKEAVTACCVRLVGGRFISLRALVFQDSHVALTLWFRAMWHLTSQKNGISALGLQRELGIGSYKTAWTLLHKLRRAMVRPGGA